MLHLLSKLAPLIILFLALAFAAGVGYAIYTVATDIASKTSNKMEKKNIHFGREGMRIGVKEVKTENYVDQTQNLLVKAWNYSTWPAYKSRFWNKDAAAEGNGDAKANGNGSGSGSGHRTPYSRSSSSTVSASKVK